MITSKTKKTDPAYIVSVKQLPIRFSRKKVNFMVDEHILIRIKEWIPEGERSNFVNGALDEALKDMARKEASEFMDKVREEGNFKMTDDQIRKAREYGRE